MIGGIVFFLAILTVNAQNIIFQNKTYIETRDAFYLETLWDRTDTTTSIPYWYLNERNLWVHANTDDNDLGEYITHIENEYYTDIINSSIAISKRFWENYDYLLLENCRSQLNASPTHELCGEPILVVYKNNPVSVYWYTYSGTIPDTTRWVFLNTQWKIHDRPGLSEWYLEGSEMPTDSSDGVLHDHVFGRFRDVSNGILSDTLILNNDIWNHYEQLHVMNCYNLYLNICTKETILTVYRDVKSKN